MKNSQPQTKFRGSYKKKSVKYFKETRGWKNACKRRAMFKTKSSIYDENFLHKTVKGFQLCATGF